MGWFEALQVGLKIAAALKIAEQRGMPVRGGDASAYVGCRELATQLQRTNPGIVQQSGYINPIADL